MMQQQWAVYTLQADAAHHAVAAVGSWDWLWHTNTPNVLLVLVLLLWGIAQAHPMEKLDAVGRHIAHDLDEADYLKQTAMAQLRQSRQEWDAIPQEWERRQQQTDRTIDQIQQAQQVNTEQQQQALDAYLQAQLTQYEKRQALQLQASVGLSVIEQTRQRLKAQLDDAAHRFLLQQALEQICQAAPQQLALRTIR